MLVKMTKIEIVGPQRHFSATVDILYSLGILHLEGISESTSHQNLAVNDVPLSSKELESRRALQELYSRINGLLLILPGAGIDRSRPEEHEGGDPKALLPDLDDLEKTIRSLSDRKVSLEEKISVVSRDQRVMEVFAPLVANIKGTRNFEMTGLTIHREQRQVIPLLKAELLRLTKGEFELFSQDLDKETTVVLILYRKEFADGVNNLLFQKQISEIALPSDLRDRPFHEALVTLHALRDSLPRDLGTVVADLQALAGKHRTRIEAARDGVLDSLSKFQAYQKFGSTRYTFVICGWVPTDSLDDLSQRFSRAFRDDLLINRLEMREEEASRVPVALANAYALRPFEVLLSLMPLPKYGSIDPTPFLALFFPLFFGMMLGDVGYGLIGLGMVALARWKWGKNLMVKKATTVFSVACLFAIAFGFLYGELFGDFGHKVLHLKPLWRDRTEPEAIMSLLIFSVALGAFHILIGYVLGIIQAIREKSAHHVIDKVAMLMALSGIFFLVGWAAKFLPQEFMSTGAVLLIIALPVLVWADGFIAPIEVLSVVGNILSYARLMAIGLSGAVLAMVANKFGGIIPNIFLAAIVVLLMHALGLAMGLFSPSIHALRLHYVEFFMKFYKSGGIKYNPFSRTGGMQ
jgi:V/A-type H+-transporting ATPase subunit I